MYKKDESKQERMFRRTAKIDISKTPNVLAEMDFAGYWESWRFSLVTRYFCAISRYYIYRV